MIPAMIATAVAPNFAIRISEKALRTSQDKVRLSRSRSRSLPRPA